MEAHAALDSSWKLLSLGVQGDGLGKDVFVDEQRAHIVHVPRLAEEIVDFLLGHAHVQQRNAVEE